MDYYKHPYCSNSRLTALAQRLGIFGAEEYETDPHDAFRLGTLFDALETEPARVCTIRNVIIGTDYAFTDDEYKENKKMQAKLHALPLYQEILSLNPDFQKEVFIDNFSIGGSMEIGMKCKLDLHIPSIVIDLKTTSATNQNSFEYMAYKFGYYRQMRLYCEMTNSDTAFIIAVSKTRPYGIFTIQMDKSHKMWDESERELAELINKYKLIY